MTWILNTHIWTSFHEYTVMSIHPMIFFYYDYVSRIFSVKDQLIYNAQKVLLVCTESWTNKLTTNRSLHSKENPLKARETQPTFLVSVYDPQAAPRIQQHTPGTPETRF